MHFIFPETTEFDTAPGAGRYGIMKLTDNGACCLIAEKIREFRHGNRLMVHDDVNVTMTFYRKDNPEKQCGVAKINGSLDFSLFDAALFAAIGMVVASLLCAIKSFLRRF